MNWWQYADWLYENGRYQDANRVYYGCVTIAAMYGEHRANETAWSYMEELGDLKRMQELRREQLEKGLEETARILEES